MSNIGSFTVINIFSSNVEWWMKILLQDRIKQFVYAIIGLPSVSIVSNLSVSLLSSWCKCAGCAGLFCIYAQELSVHQQVQICVDIFLACTRWLKAFLKDHSHATVSDTHACHSISKYMNAVNHPGIIIIKKKNKQTKNKTKKKTCICIILVMSTYFFSGLLASHPRCFFRPDELQSSKSIFFSKPKGSNNSFTLTENNFRLR